MLGIWVGMLILVVIFVSYHFISNEFVCKLIQFCLCQELVMDLSSFNLAYYLISFWGRDSEGGWVRVWQPGESISTA